MPTTTKANLRRDNKVAHIAKHRVTLCACGCKKELPKPLKPSLTRRFLQGHDAKAKSLMVRLVKGEIKISAIPRELIRNWKEIPFMSRPEFREAIASRIAS